MTMLGYETQLINGQLVNAAPGQAYAPLTFGAAYTGPGFWPRNGVYNVPPMISSPAGTASMTGGAVTGNQVVPTVGGQSKNGGTNYFHPTKSPLWWALGFLGVGLLMLHHIHYK